MSPEIRIDKELLADVPDRTGWFETVEGDSLFVDVNGINARNRVQTLILQTRRLEGHEERRPPLVRRVIELNPDGRGKQVLPHGRTLTVMLHHRPIRGHAFAKVRHERWEFMKRIHFSHPHWRKPRGG